jgi:hypothetical protein
MGATESINMNHIVNLGFSTRRRNQRGPMPLTGGAASQSVALPVNFAEDLGRARLRRAAVPTRQVDCRLARIFSAGNPRGTD